MAASVRAGKIHAKVSKLAAVRREHRHHHALTNLMDSTIGCSQRN
jgi:hypothetical protein